MVRAEVRNNIIRGLWGRLPEAGCARSWPCLVCALHVPGLLCSGLAFRAFLSSTHPVKVSTDPAHWNSGHQVSPWGGGGGSLAETRLREGCAEGVENMDQGGVAGYYPSRGPCPCSGHHRILLVKWISNIPPGPPKEVDVGSSHLKQLRQSGGGGH